jgi:hypothetical protein
MRAVMKNKPSVVNQTKLDDLCRGSMLALAAAALSLPMMETAHAGAAPERGEISFKYLDYLDYQPDRDRIAIRAPSLMIMTPIAGEWSVSASVVADSVSGASPRYHTSQITPMRDKRMGYTTSVTRYFAQSSHTFGLAYGTETDYLSRSFSYQSNFMTEDKNTTLTLGLGNAYDVILPNGGYLYTEQGKHTTDAIVGVTQVFSATDLGQVTLRHSRGRGYYSDQYKIFDVRPESRDSDSVLFRWNHHFDKLDGTLRSSYRYYEDTFKIKAHTIDFEYVQNLNNGWSVMPLLRYYGQSKAQFYYDWPSDGFVGLNDIYDAGKFMSLDQRLSAFGAVTYGVKVVKKIGRDWIVDMKLEQYEQRGDWALSNGSPGLAPFKAHSIQLGARYFF